MAEFSLPFLPKTESIEKILEDLENEIKTKAEIQIIYSELKDRPEGAMAHFDPEKNLAVVELRSDENIIEKKIHELMHIKLLLLEERPILIYKKGFSEEDKELGNLLLNYLTEDPVVYRRMYKLGLNPSYGERQTVNDFLSYFKLCFPALYDDTQKILNLYNKFDVDSKYDCLEILKNAMGIININKEIIEIGYYKKENGKYIINT